MVGLVCSRWSLRLAAVATGLALLAVPVGTSERAGAGVPAFDGRTLFRGIFFGDGPAARYLTATQPQQSAVLDAIETAVLADIDRRKPGFFADFSARMTSGDRGVVSVGLALAAEDVVDSLRNWLEYNISSTAPAVQEQVALVKPWVDGHAAAIKVWKWVNVALAVDKVAALATAVAVYQVLAIAKFWWITGAAAPAPLPQDGEFGAITLLYEQLVDDIANAFDRACQTGFENPACTSVGLTAGNVAGSLRGEAAITCFGCGMTSGSLDGTFTGLVHGQIGRDVPVSATFGYAMSPATCPLAGSATGAMTIGGYTASFALTHVGAVGVLSLTGELAGAGTVGLVAPAGNPCGGPVGLTIAGAIEPASTA